MAAESGAPACSGAGLDATRDPVRPRVVMALYGDLTYDSRVRREAATLVAAGCDVTIVCLGEGGEASDLPSSVKVLVYRPTRTEILPRSTNPFRATTDSRLIALGRRMQWLRDYVLNLRAWGRLVTDTCGPADIWHVHDLTALVAVVPTLDRSVPVVYDAHELFLDAGTASRLR